MNLATDTLAYARYKAVKRTRINAECLKAEAAYNATPSTDRAYQAGGADRYYGRPFRPGVKITLLGSQRMAMNETEVAAYAAGWEAETQTKEWR